MMTFHSDLDPSRPEVWYLLMVKAIAGIQRRDMAPATEYLRFVEAHRDRATAELARARIQRLARTDAYAEAWQIVNKILNPNAPKPIPLPVAGQRKAKRNGPNYARTPAQGFAARAGV